MINVKMNSSVVCSEKPLKIIIEKQVKEVISKLNYTVTLKVHLRLPVLYELTGQSVTN